MSKLFTRLLRSAATAVLLCISTATAYADSDGYVYVHNELYSNLYPIVEYADYFEDTRLKETSPGSNIYEGVVSIHRGLFRIYTELVELPQGTDKSYADYLNIVMPATMPDEYYCPINKLGKSDVYFADDLKVVPSLSANRAVPRWKLPFGGEYFMRLDQNTNRLYVMDSWHCLAMVNSNVAPTFDTIDKFSSLENLKEYVGAGDLKMRFFDLSTRQWLNPPAGQEEVNADQMSIYNFDKSETMGQPLSWPNWPGGMVMGLSASYLQFAPDDATKLWSPLDASDIYAVGSFSQWDFYDCPSATPVNNVVKLTIPAETTEFKLTSGPSWGSDILGSLEIKETQADNSTILYLSKSSASPNIAFTDPLAKDTEITVSLTDGTVHFPAGVSVVGTEKSELNADKDEYYIEIAGKMAPWSGASPAVRDSYENLSKNSDGKYCAYVSGLKGKAFRIISKLAPRGGVNNVIAPAAGMEKTLSFAVGNARSSASNLTADDAGWWRIPDDYNFDLLFVEVTPGENPVVSFTNENDPALTPDQIYLIGSPSGWDINSATMPLLKEADGNYYGSFEIRSYDMFRFYKTLGSWDSGSIGSQYEDYPITVSMTSGDYQGTCVNGKGSWHFPDWPGGVMYMCVNPNGNVHFSKNPIPVGEPVEQHTYWLYHNHRYQKMTETSKGVYASSVYTFFNGKNRGSEFRLFSQALGLTEDEPEWAGSYALSAPSADFRFTFDELGVAEATYIHQNDMNTKGSNPFRVPDGYYAARVVVDTNSGKVYVEDDYQYILAGEISGNVLPTFENREQFKNLRITSAGGIVDIPAGKFDFSLCPYIEEAALQHEVENIEFINNVASPEYGWTNKRVVCPGWVGGKVFIAPYNGLVNLSALDRIYLCSIGQENVTYSDLMRKGSEGLVFEGDVRFDQSLGTPTFGIWILNPETSSNFRLGISGFGQSGTTAAAFTPKDFVDGTLNVNFKLTNYNGLMRIESLKGSGRMHLTVDLLVGTLTVSLPKDNLGDYLASYAGGNTELDGIVGAVAENREDAFVWSCSVANAAAEGYDLCFICSNGNVIRPQADGTTNVTFNEHGLWTGGFTTVASQDEATAAATASSAAKWHIAPEAVSKGLVALIDNKTKEITLHSPSSMKSYFISQRYDPRIDMIEQVTKNMLKETSPGIYEGEFSVEEDEAQQGLSRVFSRNLSDNNPQYINYIDCIGSFPGYIVALNSTDNVVDAPVVSGADFYWNFVAPQGMIHVRYDEPAAKMKFTWKTSGVDNVSADASGLHIIPGTGCAYVTAVAPALVEFYSVSGVKVASQQVEAGTTVVTLPAGLYIANGAKLIVR